MLLCNRFIFTKRAQFKRPFTRAASGAQWLNMNIIIVLKNTIS